MIRSSSPIAELDQRLTLPGFEVAAPAERSRPQVEAAEPSRTRGPIGEHPSAGSSDERSARRPPVRSRAAGIAVHRDAVDAGPGSHDEDRDAVVARAPRGATDGDPTSPAESLAPLLRRAIPTAPAVAPAQTPPARDTAAAPPPSPDAVTTLPSLDPIVPAPPSAPVVPAPAAAGPAPVATGLTIGELHVEVVPTGDAGAPAAARSTAATPARPRSAIGALGRVAPSSSRFRLRYR